MFSIFNKLKENLASDTEENQNKSSIDVKPEKTEEDIIKEKIKKFLTALEDVAWDIHDDSSFYRDTWSEKREKKREAASEAYGKGSSVYPILLVDTTTFGKADCGMMFAHDGLYMNEYNDYSTFISYEKMIGKKFSTKGGKFYINKRDYDFCATKQMDKLAPVIVLLNNYFS
jgi:ribosomal protein L16 Arg81 hydroxylase